MKKINCSFKAYKVENGLLEQLLVILNLLSVKAAIITAIYLNFANKLGCSFRVRLCNLDVIFCFKQFFRILSLYIFVCLTEFPTRV